MRKRKHETTVTKTTTHPKTVRPGFKLFASSSSSGFSSSSKSYHPKVICVCKWFFVFSVDKKKHYHCILFLAQKQKREQISKMRQIKNAKAFVRILLISVELDHLILFEWCENGFLLKAIDSYHTTFVSHIVPCSTFLEPSETPSLLVELTSEGLAFLKQHAQKRLFIKMEPDNVTFFSEKDVLCKFHVMMNAPIKNDTLFHTPHDDKITLYFDHSIQELTRMFVSLNTFSGRAHVQLSKNGVFELKSEFELGFIEITRKLAGFGSGSAEALFKEFVILKFSKLLNCCDSNTKLCQIQLINDTQDRSLMVIKFKSTLHTDTRIVLRCVT